MRFLEHPQMERREVRQQVKCVGYEKEVKKEYLETEDPKPLYARRFSVMDSTDEVFRNQIESSIGPK